MTRRAAQLAAAMLFGVLLGFMAHGAFDVLAHPEWGPRLAPLGMARLLDSSTGPVAWREQP